VKSVKCSFQLVAAAADIFLSGLNGQRGIFFHKIARFVGELTLHADGTGKNQTFGFLTALGETT